MLGTMLLLAAQATADTTPAFTSMSVTSAFEGVCLSCSVDQSARVGVSWAATNFNPALHEYRLYRDDIFVVATTGTSYELEISGLVHNQPHHSQDFDFNYRVDVVQLSDSASLATRSASAIFSYGYCSESPC